MPCSEATIVVFCRAKVNLVLEILGRRSDGYHDIATVMHPIELADTVTVTRGGGGIALTRQGLPSPEGPENTAFRAAEEFFQALGQSPAIEITLHKRIPLASGLGGGSADAAGVLLALEQLENCAADEARLFQIAARVGADVPFFLGGRAALAEGIGDRLTALPTADFWLVLVLASPGISTKWAYQQVRSEHYTDGTRARRAALALLRGTGVEELWNGFTPVLEPERRDIKELAAALSELTGRPSALTGSGACVYSTALDAEVARAASEIFARRGYWSWWGRSASESLVIGGTDGPGGSSS